MTHTTAAALATPEADAQTAHAIAASRAFRARLRQMGATGQAQAAAHAQVVGLSPETAKARDESRAFRARLRRLAAKA